MVSVYAKKIYVHFFTDGRGLVFCFLLSASYLLISCKQNLPETPPTPKAVFIIIDGISADVIEKINPPALKEISGEDGYTRAFVGGHKGTYTQTPTISAVGYNSLLTATWVNKHNVWDNDIADPDYHYKDIFRIAEEFNSELKTAIFSTWTDNRTKLIGEGLPETGNVTLDYKFDGLELDTIKYPHDDNSDYIHRIDEAVADEATRYIGKNGPDLSWVYLQYTDDMGHQFGDSEKFYDAIRIADKQIARIWDAVKKREKEFNENWLVIITTDHGRDSVSGKHHGGQSDREKLIWIATNADSLNPRFHQTPGVVDIMPSICNHLGITIPDEVEREIDGVPFIGPVDFADLEAEKQDGTIVLRWKNLSKDERSRVEIFVTQTNKFKEGGEDEYMKVGDTDITSEHYSFKTEGDGKFYKILMKGPNHYLNVWVVQ